MARLVICDDESHITDILTRFFKEKGHQVFGTTRSEEALEHILSRETDLVITDIAMKGLSGFDLLRRMKSHGIEVPVIITTGNPSHNSAVLALREGAFDYVVKPFHLEEIAERTERGLVNKRIRDENVLYSKLVSLHAISKVLADALDLPELSSKVVKLGVKLTQSDLGWYLAGDPPVPIGGESGAAPFKESNPEMGNYLLKLARQTLAEGGMLVTDSQEALPEGEAWFLSMPVEVGKGAVHGVLIFRKWKLQGMYDPVDLEVFSQLGSTFGLSIRAQGGGLVPAPPVPSPGGASAFLDAFAGLVAELVDEHCLGYQSKRERVASLGGDLMDAMGWPAQDAREWSLVSRVYDLAKLRVPQKLLEKKKPLTDKEREFIHAQADWAWDRLRSVPGLEGAVRILEDLQERFDGAGSLRGAKGHGISAMARLLGVVDCFTALVSSRPYRPAYPEAEAMEILRKDAGGKFDPDIVQALAALRGL